MGNNIITITALVIILGAFIYYWIQAHKLTKAYASINNALEEDDTLKALEDTPYSNIKDDYSNTINIVTDDGNKTNIPASEVFSEINVCKILQVNLRSLDTGAGTLVGLGLLGTFIGLTFGVMNFDSSSTANIQQSIQTLLSGMGTAFSTSLAGMFLSLVYTFLDKRWRNQLFRQLYILTEKLDNKYYMDDIALSTLNQTKIMDTLQCRIQETITEQIKSINQNLTYTQENGDTATLGNAIREILKENSEQSKALKSFSTDLAIELNNGFDEVLSRQMQEKILPLMENVDTTTKAIVEHIDSMAQLVSSPASDIIENMVNELKNSMSEIIAEFNRSLSGSATSELENLAIQLGTAGQAMADFPHTMANISSTLQVTIEEVKQAITEISNTSANANSTAMQQMQEQITFATGAISNAINEVKNVMNGISHSSQEQSDQMVSKLSEAAEQMSQFLNHTVSSLSSSVQSSIQNMTEDMNSKQADLIALQEDTTGNTRKLLETFNVGLDRLEKMNSYITSTMDMFQQAQGQINGSTAHLQTISGDMKLATQLFNKSQMDYNSKMEALQQKNQEGIKQATDMLLQAGETSEDFADKFNIIKDGLGNIFASIQMGLTEYSKTVQASTQKYLDQYSTSLTNTTDALSSTIQQQNDVVEMMLEALNKNKR